MKSFTWLISTIFTVFTLIPIAVIARLKTTASTAERENDLSEIPGIEGYVLAIGSNFKDVIEKKDRESILTADFDGDGKLDVAYLLISKSKKNSKVIVIPSRSGKSTDLKTYPLSDDNVDMSIAVKKKDEPGISARKYFTSEDPKVKARYKSAVALEVSYNSYWCTEGFYFVDGKMKQEKACD